MNANSGFSPTFHNIVPLSISYSLIIISNYVFCDGVNSDNIEFLNKQCTALERLAAVNYFIF